VWLGYMVCIFKKHYVQPVKNIVFYVYPTFTFTFNITGRVELNEAFGTLRAKTNLHAFSSLIITEDFVSTLFPLPPGPFRVMYVVGLNSIAAKKKNPQQISFLRILVELGLAQPMAPALTPDDERQDGQPENEKHEA